MPTTFNVISLGNLPDMDTGGGGGSGGVTAENAAALVGMQFGGPGDALLNDFAELTQTFDGGGDGLYEQTSGNGGPWWQQDYFGINGGSAQQFDSVAVFNATITYIDGTTASITAIIFQDVNGNTYMAPEFFANADQAALEAGPIQSLTLDSLNDNTHTGLTADRPVWDFMTCFTAGTRIRTADGEVAIEDLQLGGLVDTLDHGPQPIRWIGASKVEAIDKFAPIVIAPETLGNTRELRVSPLHRMLLQGWKAELLFGEAEVLTAAIHLVNDDTIRRVEGGEVEYFHMMFDTHEIIFSEGCMSESFHPGKQAMGVLPEATREEIFELFPNLRADLTDYGPTARTSLKAYEAKAYLA